MNKKTIAKEISKKLKISNSVSLKILNVFIKNIIQQSKKNDVKIKSFGTFKIHSSPKRLGRNPKTKESYIITKRKKLILVTSNKVKNFLN